MTPDYDAARYGPPGSDKLGWIKKYLNINSTIPPQNLKGKVLSSLSGSNLHESHPTLGVRKLPATTMFVDPKARLTVKDVYVAPRGKEVWLKVDVSGDVTPDQKTSSSQ